MKKGCVLAPTLFSMVFAAMLHNASQHNLGTEQVEECSTSDDSHAKTKVKVTTLRELLFADDCALNSKTEAEMCVNHFSRACDNYGFNISTKKTEVMHQPVP